MAELYQLDEETDYAYDIQGWLEDYLDDLDMRESKEKLLEVCDELIGMFRWEEEKPSDIRFLKSAALKSLGRAEEAGGGGDKKKKYKNQKKKKKKKPKK